MANIEEWNGVRPVMGRDCHVEPGASVIGDVEMGDGCSVWHGACLRGDINRIRLGCRVNVQEGASLHVSRGDKGALEIGDEVRIGHNATVHACRIEGRALSPEEQERLIDEGVTVYGELGKTRATALARSRGGNPFRAALSGLGWAFRTQRNLRIHAAAAVAAAGLGAWLGIGRAEWVAVALCLALVPALECANTALEAAVDLASPVRHPLAKRAKDCAAAAVLLASAGAVAAGGGAAFYGNSARERVGQ